MNQHIWKDIDLRGTVRRVEYTANGPDGKPWEKYANVYLPYGYSDEKPYNILYLMHGGGGNPDAWLDSSQIKNIFDRGFDENVSSPFIVVFPTFYNLLPAAFRGNNPDADWENRQVSAFPAELTDYLIPVVEARFHTYAEGDISRSGLQKSRNHRCFGGFSMGSATTWYCFLNCLDIISSFVPLSGDCWAVTPRGGSLASKETAKALADAAVSFGMTKKDYRIYAGTGTEDPAYNGMKPQIEAMEEYPELFIRAASPHDDSGNLYFTVRDGAVHAYEEVCHHIWNYLPFLFPEPTAH